MKSLLKDESADSMIILIIATSILFFGLFYIILTYTFNIPIQAMNDMIEDGVVSLDTSNAYQLCLNMWKASPFFMLLGLVLYCYERGKGTEIPAQTFFEYLFLMIIGLFASTYLVYAFGLALDGITYNLDHSILTDHGPEWDVTDDRSMLIRMMYYFTMLPAFITSILYMLHPILKQRETKYIYDGEDEEEMQFGDIELGQV